MPLSIERKFELLQQISFAKNNSNAYMDIIGNSALVAFMQMQETLRVIGSKSSTVTAIDIVLPFLMSLAVDRLGGLLIKQATKGIMTRVTNSRIIVGKFVSDIPGVKTTTTTQLYSGVSRRFTFDKYSDALETHRLEQAYIKQAELAGSEIYKEVGSEQIKNILSGKNNRRPIKTPGLSPTVSIVDAALTYSTYQKLITNNILGELINYINVDTANELSFYEDMENKLKALHVPIKISSSKTSFNNIKDLYNNYFEKIIWAMLFFGNNPRTKALPVSGVSDSQNPRILFFNDIDKDVELTRYLLKSFSSAKEYYSEKSSKNFHVASERNVLIKDFRKIALKMKHREKDFGSIIAEFS